MLSSSSSALRVPLAELRSGQVELSVDDSKYVVKVHRLRPGDAVLVFDPETGQEADAKVQSDRLPHVRLEVGEVRAAPSVALPVTLLQALGKADKPEQAVRDATALGIAKVTFLTTERTVVRSERSERLRKIAVQVARQCGRGRIPEIVGPMTMDEALAAFPMSSPPGTDELRLICAFEPDAVPLLSAVLGRDLKTLPSVVMIGPEGGFSSEEIERARLSGFVPVGLGPLVLRTEQACTFVLSVLRAAAESQKY